MTSGSDLEAAIRNSPRPSRSVNFTRMRNLVPTGYFSLIAFEHSTFSSVENVSPGIGRMRIPPR